MLSIVAGVAPNLDSQGEDAPREFKQGLGSGIDWSPTVTAPGSRAGLGARNDKAQRRHATAHEGRRPHLVN